LYLPICLDVWLMIEDLNEGDSNTGLADA